MTHTAHLSAARCRIRVGVRSTAIRLWDASHLAGSSQADPHELLLLDLGVWIGWSTRLISDACDQMVYGFDTFRD
jgi:hypothetical protein